MHLFDRLKKESFLPKEFLDIPQHDGTTTSNFYFAECPKEVWFLADFPNCIPKVPVTWIEFRAPLFVSSTQMGTTPWNGPSYWGWLIIATKDDGMLTFHYFDELRGKLTKANFSLGFRYAEGRLIEKDVLFSAPGNIVKQIAGNREEEDKLLADWTPMLHPALFVLCNLNGAKVNTADKFLVVDGVARSV